MNYITFVRKWAWQELASPVVLVSRTLGTVCCLSVLYRLDIKFDFHVWDHIAITLCRTAAWESQSDRVALSVTWVNSPWSSLIIHCFLTSIGAMTIAPMQLRCFHWWIRGCLLRHYCLWPSHFCCSFRLIIRAIRFGFSFYDVAIRAVGFGLQLALASTCRQFTLTHVLQWLQPV